jgi:hypothetical protein
VLLTRSPLRIPQWLPIVESSFDLHALSTPPAFVLSQDQTLQRKIWPEGRILNLSSLVQVVGQTAHLRLTSVALLSLISSRVQTTQSATNESVLPWWQKLTCVAHCSVVKEPRFSKPNPRTSARRVWRVGTVPNSVPGVKTRSSRVR